MKTKVLWILTGAFGVFAMSACAPKRDLYSYDYFQAATEPAGGEVAVTTPAVENYYAPAEEEYSPAYPIPTPAEDVNAITEDDIAKFESELQSIMGNNTQDNIFTDSHLTTPRRQKPPVTSPANVSAADARFYVITGSFGSFENAQAQKATLEADGNNAGIIEGAMGMFRVYAFAGNNRAEADKELKIIRDFYPSAWLFVNNNR